VIDALGPGRYAVGIWHIDSRTAGGHPSDHGVMLVADQRLTESAQVFGRYAYSDGKTTNVRQLVQGGVGVNGLFGHDEDLTGLAISYARPRPTASRCEKVIELFHRIQATRHSRFSLGGQLVIATGNAPGESAKGLFYARLRTSF
jgi:hypothetical protein